MVGVKGSSGPAEIHIYFVSLINFEIHLGFITVERLRVLSQISRLSLLNIPSVAVSNL
jgi:hypothetical protein